MKYMYTKRLIEEQCFIIIDKLLLIICFLSKLRLLEFCSSIIFQAKHLKRSFEHIPFFFWVW